MQEKRKMLRCRHADAITKLDARKTQANILR